MPFRLLSLASPFWFFMLRDLFSHFCTSQRMVSVVCYRVVASAASDHNWWHPARLQCGRHGQTHFFLITAKDSPLASDRLAFCQDITRASSSVSRGAIFLGG
jgi:hypothetical protein